MRNQLKTHNARQQEFEYIMNYVNKKKKRIMSCVKSRVKLISPLDPILYMKVDPIH